MVEWLTETLSSPWAIWVACVFCGIGVPVPEEILGAWAGMQAPKLGGPVRAWALAGSGFLIRDLICWTAGRHLGERSLRGMAVRDWVDDERVQGIRRALKAHSGRAILAGRFMVGMRPMMWFVAGSSGIPLVTFLAFDLLGLVFTTAVLVGSGHYAGPWLLLKIEQVVSTPLLGIALAILLAVFVWRRHRRHVRAR